MSTNIEVDHLKKMSGITNTNNEDYGELIIKELGGKLNDRKHL